MTTQLQPWHLAFAWAVGWVDRQQNLAIEYLCAENRALREHLGKKRILLTDDQQRRLAVKGKELGRNGLESITTLFTPDTILRWHRQLVAQKWDYSSRRKSAGRPPVTEEVTKLIVRFAKENRSWAYGPKTQPPRIVLVCRLFGRWSPAISAENRWADAVKLGVFGGAGEGVR